MSTWAIYVWLTSAFDECLERKTHVDLLICESRLEVSVDLVIGNGAEERHIGYTSRLLAPEPFTPVRLMPSTSLEPQPVIDGTLTFATFAVLAPPPPPPLPLPPPTPPPPDNSPPTFPFMPAFLDGAWAFHEVDRRLDEHPSAHARTIFYHSPFCGLDHSYEMALAILLEARRSKAVDS